jgi:hypothetical protein
MNLNAQQFGAMRERDQRDPIYHDVQGDKAEAGFVKRHQSWLVKQPKEHQRLFCEHGRYIGHNGAFKASCPGCAADG